MSKTWRTALPILPFPRKEITDATTATTATETAIMAPTKIHASPFPPLPPLPSINAHNVLLNRPDQASWPDYPLYIDADNGTALSWTEFRMQVALAATAVAARLPATSSGVPSTAMVGILSENCPMYAVAVHALLRLAVPVAPLPAQSTAYELRHALKLTGATHVFVSPALLGRVKQAGLVPAENVWLLEGGGTDTLPAMIDEAKRDKRALVGPKEAGTDTLAYLVLSSGTSGLPKAVMITHGNLVASTLQMGVVGQVMQEAVAKAAATGATAAAPPPRPTSLAFLPMYHTYGLHGALFRPLLAPSTVVVMRKWDVGKGLEAIRRYNITALALVPSVVHQLVTHASRDASSAASIRSALSKVAGLSCGAAHLPADLKDKFREKCAPNAVFTEGYGLSEATLASIVHPPGVALPRGSAGVLLPGLRARIVVDEDDAAPAASADAPPVGELQLSGPTIAAGYWANEQSTKETFIQDGGERWLRTGDRFWVDKDGWFYFADRAKDTLKISGAQVSPREIEEVLRAWPGMSDDSSAKQAPPGASLPDASAPSSSSSARASAPPGAGLPDANTHPSLRVIDVAVAGVSGHGRTPDERVPRAWVVLSGIVYIEEENAILASLDAWARASLSRYKWLRGGIELVPELPKSPTGKTLRRVLVEEYERGTVRAKL
ncbi:hypothetical protein BD626DRAFT_502382 [Schizophyllum amplum]|uniref:AMP-dependent synthetase/ligase domain-containing protein n=1 Tax=Schizophyllum amplum TaxID=97359 RepID=A0A550C9C3_9AGAR|nr:hypothetical protein BD626DRAFT_502382 [Auriculariopsis ampla]